MKNVHVYVNPNVYKTSLKGTTPHYNIDTKRNVIHIFDAEKGTTAL